MTDAKTRILEEIANRESPEAIEIAPMKILDEKIIGVTVKDLREICTQQSSHPLAKIKLKSVFSMDDDRTVYVEVADIRAIIENKGVDWDETLETLDTGERVRVKRKKLVPLDKMNPKMTDTKVPKTVRPQSSSVEGRGGITGKSSNPTPAPEAVPSSPKN
jgi:hypothetical protein